MSREQAILSIRSRKRRWILGSSLSGFLISLAAGIFIESALQEIWGLHYFTGIIAFFLFFGGYILFKKPFAISDQDVARHLNKTYPELEESCELVLKPHQSLNLLEAFQANKVSETLHWLPQAAVLKRLIFPALICAAAGFTAWGMQKLVQRSDKRISNNLAAPVSKPVAEKILPEISNYQISIQAPAYTRRKKQEQEQFAIVAPSGSNIEWKLETSIKTQQLSLLFNSREELPLRPVNNERTRWTLTKAVLKSGFYQVKLNGKLSDLYLIQAIADQLPQVRIISPQQYSTIDFGQLPVTRLDALLNDDYGITDAYISATIASGQGEGVKFREQKISLGNNFDRTLPQYRLNKTLNLKQLGMQPGDELYYYIRVFDNLKQESRSDMYYVSIQDTAKLMSMDGMTGGVNLVPEYFRSQRQIIIDTEKLLKEKGSISREEFNTRSNDIGTDQKLLRLRYGKFLGEESEANSGEHEDEHEASGDAKFGDASQVLDEYSHKHDNAEDATFFEPQLKAQLKATLTEMWKSELQLRTYRPDNALPFEYKALRLLKDLQQKSRVYVAKTAFNPPLIKPEKRFSGELDKIISPFYFRHSADKTDRLKTLKALAPVLQKMQSGQVLTTKEQEILISARQELSLRAANNPAAYLPSLIALRKIIDSGTAKKSDLQMVERAIQKSLPSAATLPQAGQKTRNALAGQYFKNLKRGQ